VVTPQFPGAVGVSYLRVYDWESEDGNCGGSAHAHLVCTEGYFVVGGRGRVQTLSADGFDETPLTPRTVVWFAPGVIHRLVNDGDLEIVVLMQNSGLPEAGDAVFTFPPEILADPEAYADAAALASGERVYAGDAEAARRRKDLAVQGFLALRARVEAEGPAALRDFYAAAEMLTRPRRERWRPLWRRGAYAAARATESHLDALDRGDLTHLGDARMARLPAPQERKFGMCGRLATYEATSGRAASEVTDRDEEG
jgi:mannose-6-phosphate isomerase-like protein (cupin superfamily)